MSHIVLLGDSSLDNAAYVPEGEALIDKLRPQLPPGWRATLGALDGSTTPDIAAQLARLPADASHIALSVGGNNALQQIDVLEQRTDTIGEACLRLGQTAVHFEQDYRAMLAEVLGLGLPTCICTVYNPAIPDVLQQQAAKTALMVFNDAILRVAADHRLPVLDLRLVCSEGSDYANPIEPSASGGAKIAAGILRLLAAHDFSSRRAAIYF